MRSYACIPIFFQLTLLIPDLYQAYNGKISMEPSDWENLPPEIRLRGGGNCLILAFHIVATILD